MIRRRGGDDHRIDIVGLHAGLVERGARRAGADVRRRLTFGGKMAAFDPGSRTNPFVGGVERLLKL